MAEALRSGPTDRAAGLLGYCANCAYYSAAIVATAGRAEAHFSITVPANRDVRAATTAVFANLIDGTLGRRLRERKRGASRDHDGADPQDDDCFRTPVT